jgi:hypothetical protein
MADIRNDRQGGVMKNELMRTGLVVQAIKNGVLGGGVEWGE